MKKEKVLTIEEIDKRIEYIEKSKSFTTKGTIENNLCRYYAIARPVIIFANTFLFFKPKWQEVVSNLITALDKVCPLK